MRILNVIPVFPPAKGFGGPLLSTFLISKELVNRGHDVTVYTTNAYDLNRNFKCSLPFMHNNITIYYFNNILRPDRIFISPSLFFTLKKNIKRFDIIFIHSWRNFQDLVTCILAQIYDVPYVIKLGGSLPKIKKTILKTFYDVLFGKRILKNAKKIIAVTDMEKEQIKNFGISEEKIEVIPNGIDLTEYNDLSLRGCFRKRFGIEDDEKIVLYLGRIHWIKGIDVLVKAFAQVIEKLKDVKLVIVGSDDGFLNELLNLVKCLDVCNKVIFTGPLYGIRKLEAYFDADVYVLPSRYEIFGMTVLEAYSCGKPVIASKVGGLKELVVDGETGLLFEPENVGQLAESLCFMLERPEVAEKMGVKGKPFVEENFTIEKVVDRLEDIYKEVISG